MFQSFVIIGQNSTLGSEIEKIAGQIEATVGVGVLNLQSGEKFVLHDDHHFPMQSVYKFPLAMAVLKQIDDGLLSLDHSIYITREDLLPDTWSPIRDQNPEGNFDMTISELLRYTVSQSDNNGCDVLFRLSGGPTWVNGFIHESGITGMEIATTEEEMHRNWDIQYSNWSTPSAMLDLLNVFWKKTVLSQQSSDFLWKIMVETNTGPNRIRGILPEEAIVAHKTGSSGTNDEGITAATNDAGIMLLEDGDAIAVVVFVSDSKAGNMLNEKVIAEISKAAWDYYSHSGN
jgi:beta-lactamase class A